MAKKISQLTSLSSADSNDELPIVDTSAGATKKITRQALEQSFGDIALTGNIDLADTKGIRDGNNNEVAVISETASAVNHVQLANAATGNAPAIAAAGDDANVDLSIKAKGSGHVCLHNPVAFSAYKDGSQSVPTSTYTTVTSWTEHCDFGSNFNASTGVFTAPYNGYYHFDAGALIDNLNSGDLAYTVFLVNSTIWNRNKGVMAGTGHESTRPNSIGINLSAGDTIAVQVFHDYGSNRDVVTGSFGWFSGHLVARTD